MNDYKLKTGKLGEMVVDTYKRIEQTAVGGYRRIENAVVGAYQKIEDAFVGKFLEKNDDKGFWKTL